MFIFLMWEMATKKQNKNNWSTEFAYINYWTLDLTPPHAYLWVSCQAENESVEKHR